MDTTSAQDLAALRQHYETTSTADELADESAARWVCPRLCSTGSGSRLRPRG
jgi:hypothetical protein